MNENLFRASRIKIDRAKENLNRLELEFNQFSKTKPYELRHEHDINTKELLLVYYPKADIPTNWLAIIGDILFNLRSCLDLAVYELTELEQGKPLDKTEFPVFENKDLFCQRKNGVPVHRSGLYKIRGLRQKTIEVIENLQPYNIRRVGKEPILSILHEMNIVDKHRKLHVCRRVGIKTKVHLIRDAVGVTDWGIEIGANLDERAIVSRMKFVEGFDNEVYMDADIVFDIVFDKRSSAAFLKDEKVINVLQVLIKGVERILLYLEKSLV